MMHRQHDHRFLLICRFSRPRFESCTESLALYHLSGFDSWELTATYVNYSDFYPNRRSFAGILLNHFINGALPMIFYGRLMFGSLFILNVYIRKEPLGNWTWFLNKWIKIMFLCVFLRSEGLFDQFMQTLDRAILSPVNWPQMKMYNSF